MPYRTNWSLVLSLTADKRGLLAQASFGCSDFPLQNGAVQTTAAVSAHPTAGTEQHLAPTTPVADAESG